jgi:hypothetical protein
MKQPSYNIALFEKAFSIDPMDRLLFLSSQAWQRETCDYGWFGLCSARFGVHDYLGYHTIQESRCQFPDLPKILVDWQSERNVRQTTDQGEP